MSTHTDQTHAAANSEAQRFLQQAIKALRDKLIDISKRNPLIAYKHSQRGAGYVRVVDERPDHLFERLQDGEMGFEPLPDPAEEPADEKTADFRVALEAARLSDTEYLKALEGLGESERDEEKVAEVEQALRKRVRVALGLPALTTAGHLNIIDYARAHHIDPSFELASRDGDPSPHLADDRIRVLYVKERLEARLRTIHDKYRSYAAEIGVHTLYIALGFIEWPEDESSGAVHHAPLLLMQVHLSRDLVRGRYVYRLSGLNEDLSVNIALRELLRRRFGIDLPDVADDDYPESYFLKVEPLLADSKRLRIRRFVTIGIFPFPRMALWADLDPERWPPATLLSHREISILLGARGEDAGCGVFPPDYPIEHEALPKRVPPLILPADISQHSALLDLAIGSSLAIEGPPGTGKSQTIANMIAVALDSGQRVLFVAEKRAALEVVAKRLINRGFGPLMLELHSDRATKADVLQSLRDRIGATPAAAGGVLAQKRQDVQQQRDTLRRYIALLRREVGALGRPVNALYWRFLTFDEQLSEILPAALRSHKVNDADVVSELDLSWKRQALDAVEKTATRIEEAYGTIHACAWHAAQSLPPHAFGQQELRDKLNHVVIAIDRLLAFREAFATRIGISFAETEGETETWLATVTRLPEGGAEVSQPRLRAALAQPAVSQDLLVRLMGYADLGARAHAVHPSPLAADVGAIETMCARLASVGASEATASDQQRKLADIRTRIRSLSRLQGYLRTVFSAAELDAEQLSAYALRVVLAVFRRLRDTPPELLFFRNSGLLTDDAARTLARGALVAEDLRRREATLVERIDLAAAHGIGSDELEKLAASLTAAGLFGRLFGSAYKESLRRARSLLLFGSSDRLGLTDLLWTTATWFREAEAFRDEAALSMLFGAAWNGHSSDFATVAKARELLNSLAGFLLPVRLNGLMGFIVNAPTPALQALATQAQLDSDGEEALGRMDGAATLPEVLASAEREEGKLAAAVAAMAAAGVNPDAIVRTVEPSTSTLFSQLHASRRELSIPPDGSELWRWYAGADEEPERLAVAIAIAQSIVAAELPVRFAERISEAAAPGELVAILINEARTCRELLQAYRDAWRAFSAAARTDPHLFLDAGDGTSVSWTDIRAKLADAYADSQGLRWFADLLKALGAAEDRQVRFVYQAFEAARQPISRLADVFELSLVRTLLMNFLSTDGEMLGRLGGVTLDQARQRFRVLDEEVMALEAERIVAARLGNHPPHGIDFGPRSTWTEYALVKNELGKQRRHIPIRDLVGRSTTALQVLKPVWLMSPMSVAQYVPPGTASFDLVIIDEASQMRPEFAIGAIARGAKVVVVGDPKQLPPTDFFQVQDEETDQDPEYAPDSESILDLALVRLGDGRRLRWHYRSQHASLITFSNRMFYGRDLVVFPNAVTEDPLLGVKYTFVDGGAYINRINRTEAQAVIEAGVGLMYTHPDLSIGIATMNVDQRDLIFAEFERIAEDDAAVQAYMDRHARTIEPFFVKNLENVQGDERDIILVSTLYGPAPGTGVVAQRFGPINSATGHRRLNVLFSRAKMATMVFTSLRPSDIVVGPEAREGLKAFRGYLEYAADGAIVDEAEGSEPDSDFEIFVADRLRAVGYEVVPQVGVERFRIDLGVRHTSYPLGFLAGIECDGATYHATLTVRDRDRIRQDILEGLGWHIYRVWSTDWFNDPERETARLLSWLEEVRARAEARYQARRKSVEAAEAARQRADVVAQQKEGIPRSTARPIAKPASTATGRRAARRTSEPRVAEQSDLLPPAPPPPSQPVAVPLPLAPAATASASILSTQPEGRKRTIDGIDYYEVQPGFYEVWTSGRMVGEIQRLSRTPVLAARLYGNRIVSPITHYQATVTGTDEMFNVDDIYEAVRQVATRAAPQNG